MENELILGLRMLDGVNIVKFYDKFKKDIFDVFKINEAIKKGVMKGADVKRIPDFQEAQKK